MPVEVDATIGPGWFYHQSQNAKVLTDLEIFQIYLKSFGRGSSLLLNIPFNNRELINEIDLKALDEFKKMKELEFKKKLHCLQK